MEPHVQSLKSDMQLLRRLHLIATQVTLSAGARINIRRLKTWSIMVWLKFSGQLSMAFGNECVLEQSSACKNSQTCPDCCVVVATYVASYLIVVAS